MPLIHHTNPDEALRTKCVELEKIRKKDGQTAYWQIVRHLLKNDPWFMMRVALEWAWLDEGLVGDRLIKHFADNEGEDIAILLPRGHGKTLPFSSLAIQQIVKDPNTSILEISRTDKNADNIGNFISEHLLHNDYLQKCFGKKWNDDGFLPSSSAECKQWGTDGYTIPYRKPRIDPTLLCISVKGAKAGKHPDIVWLDDPTEEENNNEVGWEHVIKVVEGCWFLLPSHGRFWWTGTRWHDSDPLGRAVDGKLNGKQGEFKTLQVSCYVDDEPLKGCTYPLQTRWNMDKTSGYTLEMLEAKRKPRDQGGFGEFFDAQMRNDPAPAERADIKVKDINIITDDNKPEIGPVRSFGIEVTGGGLVILNGFREHCEQMRFSIPLIEINNPKKQGVTKRDRIVAALQPITSSGKLWAKSWMLGPDESRDTLAYELRRLGKAAHDDIADALHNVPTHMSNGQLPIGKEPAHLYLSVDLAWTEKKASDWTVIIAVAVDHQGNHWVLDYDRFQISSPTGIYDRLIKFYRKYSEPKSMRQMSRNKYPGAWR